MTEKYESCPKITSKHKGILDTKAAMIAARIYIIKLAEYLKKRPNVTIFENCQVKNIQNNEKNVSI
jgi:L-2-hydroxyglutarate oxidase LhgO